ncbi:MAG TPA: TIGR01777 family oxidoreductase [Vicinamibacterales bacterium]|nr:TIGR01777 family oxidoreductase [Vicinamibacterales bacterium]
MKIAIAGGSGFIGQAVVSDLIAQGHDVAVLTRDPARVAAGRPLVWDAKNPGEWSKDVATAAAVVNLAGENIGDGRWTEKRKIALTESRVHATRALIAAIATEPRRERAFLNASAVGFYGPRGDEPVDEEAARGTGFLADLAARWEEEARAAEALSRLVILRFGVVIGNGGALAKMLLPFKLGVGGRIGSGNQWFPWVALDDVVRAVSWAVSDESVRGVFNVTGPEPVTNRDFTRALGRVLHRPTIFPIPAPAIRLLFGQMGEETLLAGQRVLPSRTTKKGFRFVHSTVESALRRTVARG